MLVLVLLLIVSLIPAILIFFYLRGLRKEDPLYRRTANELLVSGLLCCLGVSALALVLNLAWAFTGLGKTYPLLNAFFHDFILAAFVEEFVKYHAANRGVKKYEGALTKMDIVAFFGIVAIGFDIIESVVYLIESSPMQIIIRGLCIPHVSYGFIMGWFYGKMCKTGKKLYGVLGFLIPFTVSQRQHTQRFRAHLICGFGSTQYIFIGDVAHTVLIQDTVAAYDDGVPELQIHRFPFGLLCQ